MGQGTLFGLQAQPVGAYPGYYQLYENDSEGEDEEEVLRRKVSDKRKTKKQRRGTSE